MIQQNIFFLTFRFRLRRIHPPGISAETEQALVDLVPVKLSRIGIGGVIHGHARSVIRRFRELELVHEPALLVHVVVIALSPAQKMARWKSSDGSSAYAAGPPFPWDRDSSC